MYVDSGTIITAGSILAAVTAFVVLFWKLFRWIEHQKEQDKEISRIEDKFDKKLDAISHVNEADRAAMQEELTLIIFALQACLQGLKEQGCDGPVTEAINKIDKYINQKAHSQK